MTTENAPAVTQGEEYPREEKQLFGYDTLILPQTYRVGSPQMRAIWSQENVWKGVRDVWIATAETQHEAGLWQQEQIDDLIANRDDVSVETIWAIEKKRGHDIIAAQHEYSQVAPEGGKILHNGLTSEDPLSNVETKLIHEALDLTRTRLVDVLSAFAPRILETKDLACTGWTHIQAAEPTTYGYRFSKYGQDLLEDLDLIDFAKEHIKGKGIKGPVGTYASVGSVLEGTGMSPREHEEKIMKKLGIETALITDQTYPRKNLLTLEMVLASVAQSLHRFAGDMYILQSSQFGEVREPRRKNQDASSSMVHKKNPVLTENILSITEEFPGYMVTAWQMAAGIILERTLKDSASKRTWLPMSFADIDQCLINAEKLIGGLTLNKKRIKANLDKYSPFFATEQIMADLANSGMDRKKAHEILKEAALTAADTVEDGDENPLPELIMQEGQVINLIGAERVQKALDDAPFHYGDAPALCDEFLETKLYPVLPSKN